MEKYLTSLQIWLVYVKLFSRNSGFFILDLFPFTKVTEIISKIMIYLDTSVANFFH